ncbi:MAG TPA: serine protease [Kiloniellaceae bacterium]
MLLVCAGSAAGSAAWAKPSADTVRRAAASVVRVVAEGCPGGQGSRVGTGFVWSAPQQVVTALHVVADCSRVAVEYVELGVQRRAETQRALRRADLALLAVEDPPAVPVLSQTATAAEQEELVAIGMPLNVRNWQETYGERSLNVNRLHDILNEGARRQIENLGVPAIDLEIFRLTAVVKPGSSGAPVVNAGGAVVGVVDGGLDGGNASLNWAVPSAFLHELLASGETADGVGLGPAAETVFAFSVPHTAEEAEEVNRDLACGGRSYFHLATRDLNEIVDSLSQPGTLDDPAGFLYVVNGLAQYVPLEELAAIRFDLWVDSETGATIAVPATMPIKSEAGFCLAESALGDVGLIFHGQVFNPNLTNLQSVSVQFDTAVSQVLGLAYCEPDPLLVEHVPHSRFDGLVARRSGAYCVSGSTGGQIYGIVGYLGRQNSFAGIVAINAEQLATADPRLVLEWAAAALAVLVSTYQI